MKAKLQDLIENFKQDRRTQVLTIIAVILLILLLMMILFLNFFRDEDPVGTEEQTNPTTETTLPPSSETEEPSTEEPTEPTMLEDMAALYEQNPDIIGWLTIEGTRLDYPVMFTPEDEEKYLRKNFEGKYHKTGLPFLDKDCSIDPESGNLIIYGHNMSNGTAFKTLMSYEKKSFWEEHPIIIFKTLYEERKYEIIGAFRDRVYMKVDTCFKFYQFIDPEDEEAYQEGIDYFIRNTPYDMGATAEYGDRLLTLVTCAYHHEYGRYVVVAREIVEESEPEVPESTGE